nr:DUF5071 domain-containing protein [Maliibacterium massiliense]
MCGIDQIMDMLDWNNAAEIQQEGLKLAKQVESINVFIQPLDRQHNKNVWDNCAQVLCDRSDQELKPYLIRLLEWLEDLNWPGALRIFNRLRRYSDKEAFDFSYHECIMRAKALQEEDWLHHLYELRKIDSVYAE